MKNPLKNLFGLGSKSTQQPSRTRLQLEELEARVLYSASPAPTGEPGDVDIEPDAVSYEEHTVVESQAGQPATSQDIGWGQVAAVSAPAGAETPAEEPGEPAPAASLTPEILQSTVEAAKARWQEAGLTPEQAAALDALEFQIANLGEGELARVEGNTVLIDDDAAGNGWFIDTTPLQDEEYADGRGATAGSILGVDLLSAILHEQGHVLGLHHDTDPTDGRDVMYESLGIGERRVPLAGFAEGAVPRTITQAEMLLFDTQSKITASDGTFFDEFGYAVAIDGDTAVIGAQGDDDRAANSGAAYIYKLEGGVWNFKAKLAPTDLLANEGFGRSVAISGNDVVVGVPLSGGFPPLGHAYVFNRDQGGTEAWGQVARIQSLDRAPSDNFGWSVDVEGDFIIVGARREDSAPLTDNGAAYIFARNQGGANAWGQTAKLTAATPQGNALFGDSVALTGNATDGYTAVVGASGYNNGAVTSAGAAFIFQFNGSSWTQTNILRASDPRAGISFGLFVDISGDTVIVGAPGDDPAAGTNAGSAYIFERNQGGANAWGQVKKLAASDASANSAFGSSVGINGDNIIVGASGKSASYIFGRNEGGAGQWGQITRLAPADAAGDQFGFSAAIDGNTAVVGANFDDDRGTSSGSAFFYQSTAAPVGETTVGLDANGNLLIQSTTGESDSITLKIEGGNVRISDPANTLTAGAGAVRDGSDVLVSLASITGSTGIIVDTQGGGDTLTIDFTGGLFSKAISFLGGDPTVAPGDSLVLTGGSFASAVYNFVNASSGSILLSGNAAITYTGLEPVTSTISAADVTLNYTGGSETITVSNPGIPGQTRVASTLGETLTFVNPTNSLTINAGTGNDTINVQGVGSGFAADLFVNGDDGVDVVRFQTVATNTGGGDITTAAESIAVTAAVNAGGGTITFLANGGTGTGIAIGNDVITSASGNIILIGAGGSAAGSDGVSIVGAGTDVTVVNGNISIIGTSINDDGVEITALVRAIGTGSVSIQGTTTVTALTTAQGVAVTSSGSVTTAGGNLEIEGQTSGGEGILIQGNAQTTSTGALTLTGAGSAGPGVSVNFSSTGVRSQHGDLSITGSSALSDGIRISISTVQTSGTGDLILQGTNSGGLDNGVDISGMSTVRTLGGGDLTIAGASVARDGVSILGSQVNTAGAGNLSITGSSTGTTLAAGVSFSSNSNVRTENGLLRIEGTSIDERGILVSVSTVQTTGTGDIEMEGIGGSGIGDVGIAAGTGQILTTGGDITLEGTSAGLGVSLTASTIAAGTIGNVTIRGTSTGNITGSTGVQINSTPSVTVVSSVDGNIDITGTSQAVTTNGNNGILLNNGRIESTGAGHVSLTGTGAGLNGDGVNITASGQVNSVNGDVSILGNTGGDDGIDVLGVVRSTGAGDVTLDGSTTSGSGLGLGVVLTGTTAQVSSTSGNIRVEGTGVGGSGVQMVSGSGIATGGGNVSVDGLSTAGTGVTIQSGNIRTDLNGAVEVTGTGAATGIFLSGSTVGIGTDDGDITLTGTGGTGDGIIVSGTSVTSAGAGDISLQGSSATGLQQGVDLSTGSTHGVRANGGDITVIGNSGGDDGIWVTASSTVSTTGNGTISLTGTSTGASIGAAGVNIFNNGAVRAEDGQISLQGSSANDDGILIGSTVQTTGTGGISIVGTGGSGSAAQNGVTLNGTVSSGGGDIDVTGTAGGTGVVVVAATVSAAGAGNITMSGTANGNFTDADGIAVNVATTSITSMDGDISLTGVANATTTAANDGVVVNGLISSTGAGNITLNGTGGGSHGDGVNIASMGVVNAASGNISLTGSSASDEGVQVVGGTVTANGEGNVNIAGIGGNRLDAIGAVVANGGEVRSVNGNISISGQSLEDDGIQILDGQVIVSGTGSIALDGVTTGAELFDEGVSVTTTTSEVSTTSGDIAITGQSNAGRGLLVSQATVRTTGGEIVVDADEIIVGGPGVVMDSATGNITMNAEENVTLTGVSSTGLVSLTTTGGAIVDANEEQTDITAGQLLISAPGGFGTEANSLETDIDHLEGDAGSGGVYLTNAGNLTIGGAGAPSGLTTTGDVAITVNSGSLTVSEGLSAGGDIDLTAAAVTGHGITITSDLATTGAGNITLHGTGGSGASDSGVSIQGSGISATGGNVSVHGTSLFMNPGTTIQAGGNVVVEVENDVTLSSIVATGTVEVTSTLGEIRDDDHAVNVAGVTVTFNGIVTPGLAQGVLNVQGNFTITGNSVLSLQLDGATPGVGAGTHDQVSTTGNVTLQPGATLYLAQTVEYALGTVLTIVQNGGAGAVSGIFNGLPEGSYVAAVGVGANSQVFQISYLGGTGNDIVLTAVAFADTSISLQPDGTLLIRDELNNHTNDIYTLRTVGSDLVITGTGQVLGNQVIGGTQTSTSEVRIPLSLFSRIRVESLGGNDTINIQALTGYSGGLAIEAGVDTDVVNYDSNLAMTNGEDANFSADTINLDEDASLSATDDGANLGHITLRADRNIAGEDGINLSTVNGDITLEANLAGSATGNFTGISLENEVTLSTTGTGNMTLYGRGGTTGNGNVGIDLNDEVHLQVANGNLIITGVGGTGSNSNTGLSITDESSLTVGAGHVILTGTGNGTGNTNAGIVLDDEVAVQVAGAGSISMTGTGGNGTNSNTGIRIEDETVISLGSGYVTLTGTGQGTGNTNVGLLLDGESSISVSGAGAISLTGTGGNGTNSNTGVQISDESVITLGSGDVTIVGHGAGTGNTNVGIVLDGESSITVTGIGNVSFSGIGGNGTNSNSGIEITDESGITLGSGTVTLVGTGRGSGNTNVGILLDGESWIIVSGVGGISLTGTGGQGTNSNTGIQIDDESLIQLGGGFVTLVGEGNGTGTSNIGIVLDGESQIHVIGAGSVSLTGTGGNGTNSNTGILIQHESEIALGSGTANLTGTGRGSGTSNLGVLLDHEALIAIAGAGALSIQGTGGNGTNSNTGVYAGHQSALSLLSGDIAIQGLAGLGSGNSNVGVHLEHEVEIKAADGNVNLSGTGRGAGNANVGILVDHKVEIIVAGPGALTLLGVGGNGKDKNTGIYIGHDSEFSTQDGDITIDGTGGNATGKDNYGVEIFNAVFESIHGDIFVFGLGGNGSKNNHGLVIKNGEFSSDTGIVELDGAAGGGSGSQNEVIS